MSWLASIVVGNAPRDAAVLVGAAVVVDDHDPELPEPSHTSHFVNTYR
jgi:hypothetical protein